MARPIFELKNVSISFRGESVLKDLNLSVEERDSLTIIGPGGSGKTVLLKIMAHLLEPDKGNVIFNGKNINQLNNKELREYRGRTGMLFQNYALFDSLTVRENVGFFLDYHTKIPENEISRRVTSNLKLVRLSNIEHLKPSELSGGMKKRVGIARAINHDPEILFLDEPTAGLDPVTTDSIGKVINELQEKLSATLINVTNDINCAKKIGNKLAMLYDGIIYKIGLKAEMLESKDPVVYQFIQGNRHGPIKYHERIK